MGYLAAVQYKSDRIEQNLGKKAKLLLALFLFWKEIWKRGMLGIRLENVTKPSMIKMRKIFSFFKNSQIENWTVNKY